MRAVLRTTKQRSYRSVWLDIIQIQKMGSCPWPRGNPITRDFMGWWSFRIGNVEVYWDRREWYCLLGVRLWASADQGLVLPSRSEASHRITLVTG